MLEELLKTLLDKPEKIEKAVLRSFRILISTLIACYLYQKIIGSFVLIELSDYKGWMEFFLSGRALVCALLYSISEYIIIAIINVVADLIIYGIKKINITVSRSEFLKIIKSLKVINLDKTDRIPKPGKNIDFFYKLSIFFTTEESENELNAFKKSLIEDVWKLYFAFCIVYFLLKQNLHNKGLNIIIILSAALILVMYKSAIIFIEYMKKNSKKIIEELRYIKSHSCIRNTLLQHGIISTNPTSEEGLDKFKFFKLGYKDCFWIHPSYERKITNDEFKSFIVKKSKANRVFIVIANKENLEASFQNLSENIENCKIIGYTGEEDLTSQLKQTLLILQSDEITV